MSDHKTVMYFYIFGKYFTSKRAELLERFWKKIFFSSTFVNFYILLIIQARIAQLREFFSENK